MTTTTYKSPYMTAIQEHHLTHPDYQQPPFRARSYAIVVISAVTEVGIVRCIGYGFGPHTLTQYRPFVEAILQQVGTPGIATIGQPVEWTGNIYRIPHYIMRYLDRKAIPQGIYLFRRLSGNSISFYGTDWSFEFDELGEFLAPLPRGW